LPSSAFALVNVDDKRGQVMLQNTKASKNTFALKSMADFKAKIISNTFHGLELEIDKKDVWFKLIGSFNAYNLIGVYGAAVLLDEDKEEVLTQLSNLTSARGRFDQILSETNITAIIDYAHTPDALKNVIDTINDLRQGNERLITVVGCGGNRDATKRPIMADIACKGSDKVIITSDNPRNEEPEAIANDMQKGISISDMKKTITILDRKEAIKTACSLANPKDIILIAGKGHETYQEINGSETSFRR
jgi:UDP-N-acetylmuramoyl-L-alanyl-D-glutamate--2,6-diaminopimelate ligase